MRLILCCVVSRVNVNVSSRCQRADGSVLLGLRSERHRGNIACVSFADAMSAIHEDACTPAASEPARGKRAREQRAHVDAPQSDHAGRVRRQRQRGDPA